MHIHPAIVSLSQNVFTIALSFSFEVSQCCGLILTWRKLFDLVCTSGSHIECIILRAAPKCISFHGNALSLRSMHQTQWIGVVFSLLRSAFNAFTGAWIYQIQYDRHSRIKWKAIRYLCWKAFLFCWMWFFVFLPWMSQSWNNSFMQACTTCSDHHIFLELCTMLQQVNQLNPPIMKSLLPLWQYCSNLGPKFQITTLFFAE